MPEISTDVVISGAGPNGLMLACELALAGVRPIVLDELPGPSPEPKANGLVGQVIRLLDMRGLYHEFGGAPGAPPPLPWYMFSWLPVSFAEVPDNPLSALLLPQPKLVDLLAKRAIGLGVDLRWGHRLADLDQRDEGVGVTVDGPGGGYVLAARYLVGADGGKSTVRSRVGIDFPGYTGTAMVVRFGHVSLPDEVRTDDGLLVPGYGRLPFGENRLENGCVGVVELQPGRPMVSATEFGVAAPPEDTPMTIEELRASVRRVLGVDLPIGPPTGPGPHALRRMDSLNTRQADRYRAGNVFLVGDSAHVHSGAGGPGLNLGLQDAANLGWKLAGRVNGWAPPDLLDSYHAERHPAGKRVMMHSLAQTALLTPGPEVSALRTLFTELLELPGTPAYIAHLLAGSDVVYNTGDPHPLAGRLIPFFTVETASGTKRIAELLHSARPVLLDLTANAEWAAAATDWKDRVDTVTASSTEAPATALLIRPDGYVAWVAHDDQHDISRLRVALTRWFGAAAIWPQ